jgi:hypothetical protein
LLSAVFLRTSPAPTRNIANNNAFELSNRSKSFPGGVRWIADTAGEPSPPACTVVYAFNRVGGKWVGLTAEAEIPNSNTQIPDKFQVPSTWPWCGVTEFLPCLLSLALSSRGGEGTSPRAHIKDGTVRQH